MSHFTTIQTQIKDLQALTEACLELGVELQSEVVCRGYGGISRTAHRIVRLKGPYDIAIDPSPQVRGGYDLTTDWWGGHVEKEVGPGFGRLLQSYGVAKTVREAQQRGLRVTRRLEDNGSVLLTLEGGSL
jgi:hypothetical protein